MGYRSEVSLTLYEDDYKDLVRKAKQEGKLDLLRWGRLFRSESQGKGIITMYWDWVKWYESFADVTFIETYMRSGIQYSFKRVGEENGDIDEENNDDDWILSEATSVVCEINIDDAGNELDLNQYLASVDECDTENDSDPSAQAVCAEDLMKIIDS